MAKKETYDDRDALLIASATEVVEYPAENKDSVTFDIGTPLTTHSSGSGVVRATAADNAHHARGLALLGVAPTFSEAVMTDGKLSLSDWTAITGSASLASRARYYIDATAGKLTNAPDVSTPGRALQYVGTAISPTDLDVDIGEAILL